MRRDQYHNVIYRKLQQWLWGKHVKKIWYFVVKHRQLWYIMELCSVRYLDLAGPFILGGLPSLLDSFPVSQTGFQGCIRDIYIDNVLLDLATSLADVQTQPGCVHLDDFCVSDPCHSEGSCVSEWDQYACICRKGSSGRNCHESKHRLFFFPLPLPLPPP